MFGCDGELSLGLGVSCCGKDEGYHRGNDWTKRSSPAGLISRFASFHAVRAAICISSVIRTWVVLIFNSMVRVCVGSSDCTLLRAGGRSDSFLISNGKRLSSGSSPRAASPTVSGTSRTLRIKSDPIRSASLSYPASRSCATPKSEKTLAFPKGSGRCWEWWPPGVRPPLRPRSHRAKLQVPISSPSMRAIVSRPYHLEQFER